MTSPSLTEFLLARAAEDEAVARATQSEKFVAYVDDCDWHIEAEGVSHLANFGRESWPLVGEQVAHIARHDPARVLAECEAKRQIVGAYMKAPQPNLHVALTALASVYADHPDFREEWKP